MFSHVRTALSAFALVLLVVELAMAGTLDSAEGERLSSEEITALIPNNTLDGRTATGQKIIVKFKASGTMKGRMGGHRDHGKWRVENDQFCRQWNNWVGGKETCYVMLNDEGTYKWFGPDGAFAWGGTFRN